MEDDGFEQGGVAAPIVDAPWWVDAFAMADFDYSDLPAFDLPGFDLPAFDLTAFDPPDCDRTDVDLTGHDLPGPGDLVRGPDRSVGETLLAASQAGPGVEAARLLTSLPGLSPSQDEWLTAVQLWQAQDAWAAGQRHLAVAGYAGATPVTVAGFAEDEALTLELAMAVGCSDGFAYQQIVTARALSGTLSATGDLLRAGKLSTYRAGLIVNELAHLHPEVARTVESAVIGTAAQVPTGRLRRNLTRQLKRVDRKTVNDRAVDTMVKALKGRRVEFDPDRAGAGDGLVGMYAYLPPVEALAMKKTLQALAGPYRKADGRDHDERTADALIGTVLGFDPANPGHPVKPKIKIGLLIDLPTLLRLRDNDGELLDFLHLPAEAVRELTNHASWQRLVYDPVTGYLLDEGVEVHDLPALTTLIHLRDRYDRFPGGNTQHRFDLDHTKAFKPKQNPNDDTSTHSGAGEVDSKRRRRRTKTSATKTPAIKTPATGAPATGAPAVPDATDETLKTPVTAASPEATAEAPGQAPIDAAADSPVEATDNTAPGEPVDSTGQAGTEAASQATPPTETVSLPPPGPADEQTEVQGDVLADVQADVQAAASVEPEGDINADITAARRAAALAGSEEAAAAIAALDDNKGGRTAADNLAALSRRHHRAKTFLGFHYRHLGLGILEWTTPLGRIYRTYPHDYRPEGDTGGDSDDPEPPAAPER